MPNMVELLEGYSFFWQFSAAISSIFILAIPFLFSRRRLAISGEITCRNCKHKLTAIPDVKLFDRRHYKNRVCGECERR